MIVFACHVCRTMLSAEAAQAGQLVRCRTCMTTLRVPAPAGVAAPIAATAVAAARPTPRSPSPVFPGASRSNRRYGFNCSYCSSRLEATESMAAQEGQCPTCGNQIDIPILDRYGRLIDPKTRQIIKQDPHPVHAYAAAGERAPRIFRTGEGLQLIECNRCRGISPISANNCKSCGMPFTMEGTTVEATGSSNGYCVASLVLGVIGVPMFCTVVAPLLAVIFGIVGLMQVAKGQGTGRGMAITGVVCGSIGTLISANWLISRF